MLKKPTNSSDYDVKLAPSWIRAHMSYQDVGTTVMVGKGEKAADLICASAKWASRFIWIGTKVRLLRMRFFWGRQW